MEGPPGAWRRGCGGTPRREKRLSEQLLAEERGLEARLPRLHPLLHYLPSLPTITAAVPHIVALAICFLIHGGLGPECLLQLSATAAMLAAGLAWLGLTRPSRGISLEEALILVAASWVLVPLLSAVPVVAAIHVPLVDAWFESVSGFTTTGLSVFTGGVDPYYHVYVPAVEELPCGVLWWRAATQWLGGFGVVVIFYTIARIGSLPAHLVGFAEGRFERLEPSIAKSMRALMKLYIGITAVSMALFMLSGMGFWEALYHAMAAVSTGGFSTHSANVGYYHSVAIYAAAIASMLMGAMNFADLYAVFSGKPRRMSIEEKAMAVVLVVAVAVLLLLPRSPGIVNVAFDASSALSTTGFGIHDLSNMTQAYKLILVILMLIGGSAFSTAGGIKLYRAAVLASTLKWSWSRVLRGSHYLDIHKVGGEILDFDELARVVEVALLFILLDIVGTVILLVTVPHLGLADALFEATSAVCTTGLSVGVTSASTPLAAKLTLLALMDLGRLEIHVYIAALAAAYLSVKKWRHARRRAALAKRLSGGA